MISLDDPAAWFGIALCASGIFLAWRLARAEWHRYQTPAPADKPFASHGRLSRRLFGSFLLGLVMILLALGLYALPFEGRPALFIAYWGVFCLLLALMAFVAVADLLETHRIVHHQNVRTLKRMLDQHRRREGAPAEPEKPDSSADGPS